MAPPARLSLVVAGHTYIEKEHMLVWFRMFPAGLAKRRRQNNVNRISSNIQVHMWASTQLRNCGCSHLLASFGRVLGSMLDLSHVQAQISGGLVMAQSY